MFKIKRGAVEQCQKKKKSRKHNAALFPHRPCWAAIDILSFTFLSTFAHFQDHHILLLLLYFQPAKVHLRLLIDTSFLPYDSCVIYLSLLSLLYFFSLPSLFCFYHRYYVFFFSKFLFLVIFPTIVTSFFFFFYHRYKGSSLFSYFPEHRIIITHFIWERKGFHISGKFTFIRILSYIYLFSSLFYYILPVKAAAPPSPRSTHGRRREEIYESVALTFEGWSRGGQKRI